MTELDELRAYLLAQKGAVEETPFGPDTLVFKVGGKMFALISWTSSPLTINLKCDPDEALFLREHFAAVNPGYHMNKRHWNTLTLDGSLPEADLRYMIDQSYRLVIKGLPGSLRESLS